MEDLDEHIFSCPGYQDIIDPEIKYEMLWDKEVLKDMGILKKIADCLKLIIERMKEIQKIC